MIINDTHSFDEQGICRGCAMRRTWPGAADACSVRHEYSMTVEERARRRHLAYVAKKKYVARRKASGAVCD